MPILYPIAVINFMFLYWIYKALILKQYQKASSFNQDLPFLSIYFFKAGLILHVLWTVFMFTETQLLTVDITAAMGKISQSYAEKYVKIRASVLAGVSYGDETRFLSAERFTSGVGILYLLYLVIMIAFYVFRKTLILLLEKLCLALCPKCCCRARDHVHDAEARDQELAAGLDTYSRDFLADLRMGTLADKYRKAVVDFHDAQQYEVAEFNMMNQELKDSLLDVLKRRLRWIESAIDAHVDSLIEEKII